MRTIRIALAAAVLAVGVTGCGGDPEAEVRQVVEGYHTAALARDFPAACAYNSPQATEQLLASVATQGIRADTCEQALEAIYAQSGAADTADAISRSARIDGVEVDGDEATVSWTATLDGQSAPTTSALRRIDGEWKLAVVS